MPEKVFYAWQSDRDQAACRFLIRDAAKQALKKLNADAKLTSAPPFELDHDTKDTTGHQHIAAVIRKKIKGCGVFLADLTHVTEYQTADDPPRRKRAQNPNVLIELGIAIRAKGFGRLIMVMNDAFGSPDELPFDLKSHSYPLTYRLTDTSDPTAVKKAREGLAEAIKGKLKPMLTAIHEKAAARLKAREESDRSVTVKCQQAFARVPGSGTVRFLSIDAVNTGTRPVTIAQAGIVLSDGRTFIPMQTRLGIWKLPTRLQESDTVSVLCEVDMMCAELEAARSVGNDLRMMFAYLKDSSNNMYHTESLEGWPLDDLKPIIE